MKLDDLKEGMVVVLRNEEPYIVSRKCAFHGDVLVGYRNLWELWNTQIDFNCYEEDMTFKGKNMKLFDIMKIYEKSRDGSPFSKGKLLWQREEYKEVTMKEIEEKFGCKVKIVGGENRMNNGWISCNKRLPEDDDCRFYMCTVENHEDDPPMYCQYDEELGFGFYRDIYDPNTLGFIDTEFRTNSELGYENVIAWMPLPEPYKESD